MAELFGIAIDSTDENVVSEPELGEKKTRKIVKTAKKKVGGRLSVNKNSRTEKNSDSMETTIFLSGIKKEV